MPVEEQAAGIHARRQQDLWEGLRGIQPACDAMVITSAPNIRYLTGFTGSNGIAVVTATETLFLTDPRYTYQAAKEVHVTVQVVGGPLLVKAAAWLTKRRFRTIGFEQDHLTAGSFELLGSKLPAGVKFVPRGGVVEQLRMVKSDDEIALIRKSVATNSRALEVALRRFRVGMSEMSFAAEIDYAMRKLGAEKTAFDTIVASGERSALPHAHPTHASIEPGVLLIDMGAMENGYASDMTRTYFVGSAPKRVAKIYRAVLEAQLAGIAAVRPGVTASAVDRACRDVMKKHGLEKEFLHSTGHGLGLEVHEGPRLGKREKTKLRAGMALTIEPGGYVEGVGGVRIEDTVIVTATGCEVLTDLSKRLTVL